MARPDFVVCDTDALIQLFLNKDIRPLGLLRSRYRITPVIMPEVEIELGANPKYGRRIAPQVRKALTSGVLKIVNSGLLEAHYGGGTTGSLAAHAAFTEIQRLGKQFQGPADLGEAYTHAAALTLKSPALSHDRTALDALSSAGFAVPPTVLRTFDLLVLFYQVGDLSEGDCDAFRQAMNVEKEFLPSPFKRTSFADGLNSFAPRLIDGTSPRVGSCVTPSNPFSTSIVL
jgi:hypothetical protein